MRFKVTQKRDPFAHTDEVWALWEELRELRGTREELEARLRDIQSRLELLSEDAWRSGLQEAVDYFLTVLAGPAGCARPEVEHALVVIAYSSGLEPDKESQVLSGAIFLNAELERLTQEHSEFAVFDVQEPVRFIKGDGDSLRLGLSRFGEESISDLFIFGHGWSPLFISNEPDAEPPPKYVKVGGLSGLTVAAAVMSFMKPPARVRIEACSQRRGAWESLSANGIEFSSPTEFENSRVPIY